MVFSLLGQVFYFLRGNARAIALPLCVFALAGTLINEWMFASDAAAPLMGERVDLNDHGVQALIQRMLVLFAIVYMTTSTLMHIIFTALFNRLGKGESAPGVGEIVTTVLRCFPSVFIGGMLVVIVSVLGLSAFILPGIYLYARLCLFEVLVVSERLNVFAALSESFRLSRDFVWSLIGVLFFALSVSLLLASIVPTALLGIGLPDFFANLGAELVVTFGGVLWLAVRYRVYMLARSVQAAD